MLLKEFLSRKLFQSQAGVCLVSRHRGNTPAVGPETGPNMCGQKT